MVYFHGNGGSLHRAVHFDMLAKADLGVVAMTYRGYGGGTGKPFEAGLKIDALAAFDFAAAKGGPLIVFGEPLETDLAGSGLYREVVAVRAAKSLHGPVARGRSSGSLVTCRSSGNRAISYVSVRSGRVFEVLGLPVPRHKFVDGVNL